MGYILPINHYQYQDYHERTIQTERSPFALEQIFKATLDSKLEESDQPVVNDQEANDEKEESPHYAPHHIHLSQTPSETILKTREKIYSQVTGKGQLFSESI